MIEPIWVLIAIAIAVMASVFSGKIDVLGGLLGGGVTFVLYAGIGWLGIWLIGSFFVLGTAASIWKLRDKQALGLAEDRNVQRSWQHVLANSGVSALIAMFVWLEPAYVATGYLLISACFAAALSDTWSSELGNVYGTKFYHVLTGRKDVRGHDGVVSLEGSLAGVIGSGVMATVYGLFHGFDVAFGIILWAGVMGNLTDSLLGASVERRGILGNHTVNFLNTAVAALVAYFLVKNCSISV